MNERKMMSGAEFKEKLAELLDTLKDDDKVYFGSADSPLTLYRFKDRGPVDGPRSVQIEFNEVYKITAE